MKSKLSFLARSVIVICMLVVGCSQAWAWNDFALIGDFSGSTWTAIYLQTKVNDNHFTGTIDASSWVNNKTYNFKFYNEENGGKSTNYWGSTTKNPDFTSTSTYTIDEGNNSGNMTLKHNSAYSSYTVDAEYKNNSYWHVTITGVSSETKYTINIINGAGGTVSPTGNQQVGATGINVTATPSTGYTFKEWTTTDGAHVTSTTSATTKLTADAAGTLKANFEKVRIPLYCWYETTAWFGNNAMSTTTEPGYDNEITLTYDQLHKSSGNTLFTFATDASDWNNAWRPDGTTSHTNVQFGTEYTKGNGGDKVYELSSDKILSGYEYTFYANSATGKFKVVRKSTNVTVTVGWAYKGDENNITMTYQEYNGSAWSESKNVTNFTTDAKDACGYVWKNATITASGSDITMIRVQPTDESGDVGDYAELANGGEAAYLIRFATSSYTATKYSSKSAAKTVEESVTYSVNVIAGAHGSVSPTETKQVGVTPVTIIATAEVGYQFSHWTTSGGVSVADVLSANTTITATSAGTIKANFEEYTAPEMAYYLVGNLMDTDNSINTSDRKFRFFKNTDGTYYFDLPATLTVDTQIAAVAGTESKIYGPASGNTTFNISDKSSATHSLAKNSHIFTAIDRGLEHSGIYRYTLSVDANGNPTSVTVSHDMTRLVAYYWPEATSTNPNPTAQPTYTVRKNDGSSDNRYYGNVNLEDGQHCWVISNITKNADNNIAGSPLVTVKKLYKQGNGGGNVITRKADDGSNAPSGVDYTRVYPYYIHKDGGDDYKANQTGDGFTFGKAAAYTLEYNPSKGIDEVTKVSENKLIGGEVLQATSGQLVTPITSINIIGTGIPASGSWNLTSKQPMTYNQELQCYEYSFVKTTPESKTELFRFVANKDWSMNWEEDGTDDADKARVPYRGDGAGHSALESDPNYIKKAGANGDGRADAGKNDIIFNRPAGIWTIRFYIKTRPNPDDAGNYFVDYYYTITGKEDRDVTLTLVCNKYIRTYSNSVSMDMPDGMKAYEAYKFEDAYANIVGTVEDKDKNVYDNCKVYLRQLKYIPANMGVVLVVDQVGVAPEATKNFTLQTRIDEDYDDYRDVWVRGDAYIANGNQWNNFLVPTVTANNNVGNASYDGDGNVTYRHFGLSNYHSTAYYQKEHKGEDYLGFFRLADNGRSGANKAYLSIPSSKAYGWNESKQNLYGVLNYNAQLSGQETDENGTPSLAKAMILFDDILFDEEDNIVTGVMSVNQNADNSNVYYNMQGVRVLAPTKGLYISNGKKIVIK